MVGFRTLPTRIGNLLSTSSSTNMKGLFTTTSLSSLTDALKKTISTPEEYLLKHEYE